MDLFQNGIHPKAARPIFQLKTESFELNIGLVFDGKCVYLILPSGAGSVLSNLCRKDVKKQSGAIVGHLGCLFCLLFYISIHLSS